MTLSKRAQSLARALALCLATGACTGQVSGDPAGWAPGGAAVPAGSPRPPEAAPPGAGPAAAVPPGEARPGPAALRRLGEAEYRNTVAALLGAIAAPVQFREAAPVSKAGFTNFGDVLLTIVKAMGMDVSTVGDAMFNKGPLALG